MPRSQFASTKTPSPATLNAIAGNLSNAANYSIWLYCRNRAGITLFSDRSEIGITVGQGIEVILPSSIKANGSEIREIGVVLGKDNTSPLSGGVVAVYPGGESLPAHILLTEDEQVMINGVVANEAALPSTNLLHGMRRYVDSLGVIQRWNQLENRWETFYPQTFNPYVPLATVEGGADVELSAVTDTSRFIIPDYEGDGSASEEVTFWIVNDTSVDIDSGTRVRLSAGIAQADLLSEDFAGLLEVEFLGYVNTATAELETVGMSVGGWIPYDGIQLNTLVLPKNLPPGFAYILNVRCNFLNFALGNTVLQGAIARLYPYFAPYKSVYDSNGRFLGDHIRAEGDRRRVVPNGPGLELLALGGSGTVKSFRFDHLGSQIVPGLQLNTANQQVLITNNGTCFVTDRILSTAALRAIVSTEDGEGIFPSTFDTITLRETEVLELTLTAPTHIRDDYPDAVKGTNATLNANKIRVYLSPTGTNNWSYWEETIAGETPEIITIGNTPGTQVGAKSGGTNLSHGLFKPDYTVAAISGTSTFNGEYDLAVVFVYENTVTAISHAVTDGCINEDFIPYGEIISYVTSLLDEHKNDTSNPHNITADLIGAVKTQIFDDLVTLVANNALAIAANRQKINPLPKEIKELPYTLQDNDHGLELTVDNLTGSILIPDDISSFAEDYQVLVSLEVPGAIEYQREDGKLTNLLFTNDNTFQRSTGSVVVRRKIGTDIFKIEGNLVS